MINAIHNSFLGGNDYIHFAMPFAEAYYIYFYFTESVERTIDIPSNEQGTSY